MVAQDNLKALGYMCLKPSEMGLEAGRRVEWLLTNGLGGYSSSTILGMNSRKYHGLLIASRGNLETRRVVLENLAEELMVGADIYSLFVGEYADTTDSRGLQRLKRFTRGKEHVKFEYEANGTHIVKIIHLVHGMNALVVSYGIRNNFGSTVTLNVRPLVNSRGIHELNTPGRDFKSTLYGGRILGSSCGRDNLMFYSEDMGARSEDVWFKSMRYCMEAERGEASDEDVFCPGVLEFKVPAFSRREAELFILLDDHGLDPIKEFSTIKEPHFQKFEPVPSQILESAADSFIVYEPDVTTVVAGYHWFADWGRDTMISLPGLALQNRRFKDAEAILARFIDNVRDGRIPTKFEAGGPTYYDFDGSLWMIDRLNEYVKCVKEERAVEFLAPRWPNVMQVVQGYMRWLDNGLIKHKSGTWMDTLERNDAVEVQALWYNALHIIEGLSQMVGAPVDASRLKSDFESSFMDKYWNGTYLRDCLDDDSIRPNQVIAASLRYSPVPEREAAQLMKVVEEELLTPCGLRTLNKKDPKYVGKYAGGVEERTKAYHNGTVWPWLIGPYTKTAVRVGGEKGRKHALEALRPILKRMAENCLGTIPEIYDGDPPHTPRGAVSQAWSVAEVLRAYREDAQAKED